MEVRSGYKQTEVGVIPQDWEVAKLAAVCTMKSGEGITSASIDQFSEYPCYGGNGLRGFTARFTHDGRYGLIGRQGALCGNVLGVEGKLFASEHAIVVTPSARTDIRWLTFVLGEMRLNQYSESSAQPGLSVSKLLSLDIARPPTKAEQEAIAEALSDADALIESLDQLLAKKLHLKQGAMQELLTGKKRLPGFQIQPGYKQTEIGVIPEDWEVTNLGTTCTQVTTGKLDVNAMKPNGQYRFYTCARDWYYIDTYAFDTEALLVSGNGANVGYIHYYKGKFNAYQRTYVLSGFLASIKYLQHYMGQKLSDRIRVEVNAGNTPYITRGTLTEMKVAMPPTKAEQEDIAAILSDMDAEIATLEAKLAKTRQLKQGMMQELLTGKIRLV